MRQPFFRFLHRHGLWPALLSTAACVGVLEARLEWSQRGTFVWLLWNLFLAWVPYALSLVASFLQARGAARWWSLVPLGGAWLLVFPNAPYLLTDFIHLRPRHGIPLWFDVALLALFAATGWLLGLLSLEVWKRLLEERVGRVGAWVGVAGVSVLCGYGIYLGRVERWNSWDVLTDPRPLLGAIVTHLREPREHPELLGITAIFTVLVLLSYCAFEHLRPTRRAEDAQT
ncbi:DUF1361 domain-containing protein [Hyalangium rubrum]|uniref:DUF1361 domain-containing protein n=1 Tax=Hyalangium rubrum TaxID=3103134 RepID=A0ABU5H9Z1_9BACT|nr:DUF1361 domain-containing protein [Hyalangium sp. s54d21]MDY7230126.1 DUF1361 domain-containing protein [Hyalangium sp. s54d21]